MNTTTQNPLDRIDPHLAKYTLARFDAATQDPSNGRLYLAAAAYLAAWWHQHDHTTGAAT